jgi:hypothetical protein
LKSSLFLIEEVEEEIKAAKAKKVDVTRAEAKIKEARKLFEMDGAYAEARLAALDARGLPAAAAPPIWLYLVVVIAVLISVASVVITLRRKRA